MTNHTNLHAYNSIELLSAYKTKESLQEYRNSRIIRYQAHANFILNRSKSNPVSIIEIGSGSSVLLYMIAQKNILTKGIGIELSKSRYEFAEQWKKDDGYEMVENINKNFVDVEIGNKIWDWFIVIDNTFTYLSPEDENYPSLLLKKAFDGLKEGGRIIIDFINYARRMQDIEYKSWSAFASNDPFSYGLYSNKITNGINRSESIFIKRDGSESKKIEFSKVYSLEQLNILLSKHGFIVDEVLATFDEQTFNDNESERLLVVARKKS